MKKNKRKVETEEPEIGENLGNPFADLKVDVPPPPEPPKPAPPPPPTKEEMMEAELSYADKELLKAFRSKDDCASINSKDMPETPKASKYTFAIQRKGHNGRTVTLVNGFREWSFAQRMELCSKIKAALGIGARFLDLTLELQGDQRERAAKWLADYKL